MHVPESLIIALLLAAGFLCQWLAWRVRLPAILFLLLTGILIGPVAQLFDPDRLLGQLLFPFVSLGVAVILFEGSLTLRLREIRGEGSAVLGLVTVGVFVTLGILAWAAHTLVGWSWELALLFGAVGSVTGPTVVMPMLRSVRPTKRIANVLRWEGIVIDPFGALLAVLVYEWIALGYQEGATGIAAWIAFGKTVGIGTLIGFLAAPALGFFLRRHLVPEYLENFATLAVVLLVFTGCNAIEHESGLLAVTIMGMRLANDRRLQMDDIMDFKEHLSTLLISLLFIVLAARLSWPAPELLWGGLGVLAVAVLVARPLAVLLSTLGSRLTWPERGLIAWIAPRGIVAASVAALFALRLEDLGVPNASELVPLTFLLIIGTVVLQSATARRLAALLGVTQAEPRGVLIVGANQSARLIAQALKAQKTQVQLADDDWACVRRARMQDLPTYFGNPVTEHSDRDIDLAGIGYLLAISTRRELNSLATVRFRPEFGKDRVFYLRNLTPDQAADAEFAAVLLAPALFGSDVTNSGLSEREDAGWKTKSTKLSDSFSYGDLIARYAEPPLLLFAYDDRDHLRFATAEAPLKPKAGWTVTTFVNPGALIVPADAFDTAEATVPAPQPAISDPHGARLPK